MSNLVNSALKMRNQFFLLSFVLSFSIVTSLMHFYTDKVVMSVAVGFLIGICDNLIMFLGVVSGVKKTAVETAVAIMKKNKFKRIAFVGTAFLVAIKVQMTVLFVLLAFLFIHMLFLVFLILNALLEQKASS